MTVTSAIPEFRIGRVIRDTIGVLSRNALMFLPVAMLATSPMLITDLINGTTDTATALRTTGPVLALLPALLQIICPSLLQAALVRSTIDDLTGERPSLGATLSTGFSLFLPVLGLSLVSGLGIGFGLLLLVVPGIMLAMAWAVVVPVRIVERTGFWDSFNRSGALTDGNRWKILGLYLVGFAFFGLLIGFAAFAGAFILDGTDNIPFIIGMWVMMMIIYLVSAVGTTAIYLQLRTIREGASPEEMSAFD